MLEASITFSGAGQLCMYTGNCEAIQAPAISQAGAGQYMVQFLTGRHIDRTKIPCASITVTCQNPSGIAVIPIVFPSPTSIYNANATGGYFYTITFGVQTLSLTGAFVNPIEVMVNIVAKNQGIVEVRQSSETMTKAERRYRAFQKLAVGMLGREYSPQKAAEILALPKPKAPTKIYDQQSSTGDTFGVYQALRSGGEEFR
jgi:hypothetical protein